MKKHRLIMHILELVILISSLMESQQSEKDFIKLLPETPTIDKQLHKIRKLEEPQIKDQYTCTVNKVGGTLKTENNVFTFDLYDNNFTKNMEPSFTFSFIYFLIKNFTQDLELIQATLEGNALTSGDLTVEYDNITAGDVYFDKDEDTGEYLLNMELTDNNYGYKIGKLSDYTVLKGILGSVNIDDVVEIECQIPRIIYKLRINNCIDMKKPKFGVYVENIEKFIDLKSNDKCVWEGEIPVQNNTIYFKTIHYQSLTSEKFGVERNYSLDDLRNGIENDKCTLKNESSTFILNCTFQ